MSNKKYRKSAEASPYTLPSNYVCIAIHTVTRGESLFSISRMHNVPVAMLMQANNISNPASLPIGRQICIPGESAAEPEFVCDRMGYTAVAGDTFYLISRKVGVSVDNLMKANPTIDPYNLIPGTVLCIPRMNNGEQPSLPDCGTGSTYTIQQGDTFYLISRRFGISVDELMLANPSRDPYNLQPGMIICIPRIATPELPAPPCVNARQYTIRNGDTFYTLSRRFGVSVQAIIDANPTVDPYNLQAGMVICIPNTVTPAPMPTPDPIIPAPPIVRPPLPTPLPTPQPMPEVEPIWPMPQPMPEVDPIIPEYPTPQPMPEVEPIWPVPQPMPEVEPIEELPVPLVPMPDSGVTLPPRTPYQAPIEIVEPIDDMADTSCPRGTKYKGKRGDTLCSILKQFNVSYENMLRANPNINCQKSLVGKVICIPISDPYTYCSPEAAYTVVNGDNLANIACKFRICEMDLLIANSGKKPNEFSLVGTKICIPTR